MPQATATGARAPVAHQAAAGSRIRLHNPAMEKRRSQASRHRHNPGREGLAAVEQCSRQRRNCRERQHQARYRSLRFISISISRAYGKTS